MIGRVWSAALVLDDPRISEAHALVSLRNRSLRLMALRGALTVDGRDVDSVTLAPGLRVELADGVSLTVEAVELPTHSLVLCGAALMVVAALCIAHALAVRAALSRLASTIHQMPVMIRGNRVKQPISVMISWVTAVPVFPR